MLLSDHKTSPRQGRPPGMTIRCEHGRCRSYAAWSVPDIKRCHNHMTADELDIAQRRMALWNEMATALWEHIMDEVPS